MPTFTRGLRVKVLVAFPVALFLYASINQWKAKEEHSVRASDEEDSIYHRKGKVVILLSNQRSGSSFVGEFFNRFERGFYLFEPLLPYTPSCAKLYDERLDFLRHISHCDFRTLPSSYSYAYETLKVKSHRECLSKHVCFANNHPTLIQRYTKLCMSMEENLSGAKSSELLKDAYKIIGEVKTLPTIPTCGLPANLTLWSSLCYSADLVAYKILRICSLSALEGMARQLTDMGNEVYVVELVRDPRAIINSALKLELKKALLNERLDALCGRYEENFDYVDAQKKASSTSDGIVASGSYMRVRYEDIATDPVKGASDIYTHLGMDLPEEIKHWIEETSISPDKTIDEWRKKLLNESLDKKEFDEIRIKMEKLAKEKRNPYGTVRDPQQVLVKWRKQLNMDTINKIQSRCGTVMERMGYKLINSEEEKNDLNLPLW